MPRIHQQPAEPAPTGRPGPRGAVRDRRQRAFLAAQRLAGNAAVDAAVARRRGDATPPTTVSEASSPTPTPVLTEPPRLGLRLPASVAERLGSATSTPRAKARRPGRVRVDLRAGGGERSPSLPALLATGPRAVRLTARVEGFSPLDWEVPPPTVGAAQLDTGGQLDVRLGRTVLTRGRSTVEVTVADRTVTVVAHNPVGELRLTGQLQEDGTGPDAWDLELELDRRRLARLLEPRRRRGAPPGPGAGGADDQGPPDDGDDPGTSER